jgi:hypothetical protein
MGIKLVERRRPTNYHWQDRKDCMKQFRGSRNKSGTQSPSLASATNRSCERFSEKPDSNEIERREKTPLSTDRNVIHQPCRSDAIE